jgi:uncharacterized protein YoxC
MITSLETHGIALVVLALVIIFVVIYFWKLMNKNSVANYFNSQGLVLDMLLKQVNVIREEVLEIKIGLRGNFRNRGKDD